MNKDLEKKILVGVAEYGICWVNDMDYLHRFNTPELFSKVVLDFIYKHIDDIYEDLYDIYGIDKDILEKLIKKNEDFIIKEASSGDFDYQ